ncbi:Phosphate transport system permease protein PstA (TC 3.A.1.7.1) [uncultured Candidatus Thioglobus sp.]|nr:Phosphate transport system permease protein PstA (TC 3.A.1.7.1) [uncultured Candidatus Thioglobus sp.]
MNKQNTALLYRYGRERCFIWIAKICIVGVILFLGGLITSIVWKGWHGFLSSEVQIEIMLDPNIIGIQGEKTSLSYQKLIKNTLREKFPEATSRAEKKQIYSIISAGAGVLLQEKVQDDLKNIGKPIIVWLPAGAIAASYFKGATNVASLQEKKIPAIHIQRLEKLKQTGKTRNSFNYNFFISADSRNPEMAGIGNALRGSFYTLLITFFIAFPTGTLTAVYLELFAPRAKWCRWWLDFLEININNLAAVPSIIFGLLGLAIFINIFHLPRSSPLLGGVVLALMTLPTIIIVARAALKSVPPSLLAVALSLGATRMQGVLHHVLPAAMPGILTGTIIGMAQALGETAPLLMLGMVAFIANAPESITDAATVLPVQIFLWASSPESGFAERTSMAIIILLFFLVIMNAVAVFLRHRLEIKW